METIRIHKPKDRTKELNKQNLQDILYLLQIVSYTDSEHQADYYGDGFGSVLKAKQQGYIDVLKGSILNCSTKTQIQKLFTELDTNVNYFPGFVKEDIKKKDQKEYWNSSFGKNLLIEWKWMCNKFVSHINNMIEIP